MCRQLAEIRLVANERNAPPFSGATGSLITARGVWPGASASSVFTAALLFVPCASRFAVCLARTSGLVKISSISTSSQASPLTTSLNRAMPVSVSGRFGVVRPLVAAFRGNRVANQIQIARLHTGYAAGVRAWSPASLRAIRRLHSDSRSLRDAM